MAASRDSRSPQATAGTRPTPAPTKPFTNSELAGQLLALAQTLSAQGENPFKVRAYRRAAKTLEQLGVSVDDQIRTGQDVTQHAGIGQGIAAALREIVMKGRLGQMDLLVAAMPPELAGLADYPKLDVRRVKRVLKKLGLASVAELRNRVVAQSDLETISRSDLDHLQQAFSTETKILLFDADPIAANIEEFLRTVCGATRVQAVGAFRRRCEIIDELGFLVATPNFSGLLAKLANYSGGIAALETSPTKGRFRLPSGIPLWVEAVDPSVWGWAEILRTGSAEHLAQLNQKSTAWKKKQSQTGKAPDETTAFRSLGLEPIPPELREGHDEIDLAAKHRLPRLVELTQLRGDLHVHTTGSDGWQTIEVMAARAKEKGYDYLGITDHSQSLKIARGMTPAALWKQIRTLDRLNEKGLGIRLLKSAEVDIRADGSLDYSDDLLAELDYTVCSIHSRFSLGKKEQTERILRAMDSPHFGFLGHATGRRLLKRAGYEIDLDRVIAHAKALGRGFEINASPERLDLSAESARLVAQAGIKIAVNTDAHHTEDFEYMRYGLDVARRAGLTASQVLNTLPLPALLRSFKR